MHIPLLRADNRTAGKPALPRVHHMPVQNAGEIIIPSKLIFIEFNCFVFIAE